MSGMETRNYNAVSTCHHPVSTAIASESSDAGLPEANTSTGIKVISASDRSGVSTCYKVQLNKWRQVKSKATAEDKLLCAWLESETVTNSVKTELIELQKTKTLLEIQNLESKLGNDPA